jgi:hypothetical protein
MATMTVLAPMRTRRQAHGEDDAPGRFTVNGGLTVNRRPRVTENDEYSAFVHRVLRAYARRVARGDIDAIGDLAAIAGEADRAMRQAVAGLRKAGYSWADIGTRLGVTKQAAQQRWGSDPGPRPQGAARPRLPERPEHGVGDFSHELRR